MVSIQAAIVAIALSGVGQTGMLDFYADWCGPCRAMSPTVQALVAAGYPVHRVNVDQNRALAAQYHIKSIPCFVMIVNGREVDRVVGGTTYYRLEQMCKRGALPAARQGPPTMLAGTAPSNSVPAMTVSVPAANAAGANNGWGPREPAAASGRGDGTRSVPATAAPVPDAALLAASVRVRVEDPTGHSCGSGTIIDARGSKALILTCGHIFRESQGKGRIEVDLFGPNGPQRVAGTFDSCDFDRDIGLIVIDVPGPVATARVAPPGYRVQPGAAVVSIGCNNGESPTVQHSRVTTLDKFLGPPNIQVAGQPVEGRSGGGLFSSEGYVIGVCNAADPSDREGLFAGLPSIYAQLNRKDSAGEDLSFVYKLPSSGAGATIATAPTAVAAQPAPYTPGSIALVSTHSAAPLARSPAPLAPPEQAAMDEIQRSLKEGAEVTIVVRPRGNPAAKSEVYQLDHASADFLKRLSAENRGAGRPALDVPATAEAAPNSARVVGRESRTAANPLATAHCPLTTAYSSSDVPGELVVEVDVLVAALAGAGGHGTAGMLVELAGDVVLGVRPPLDRLAQRQQMVLEHVVDRPDAELRVAEEADQQLHRAVARPAAQAGHRGVDPVGAVDDRLDRVGEGQLLVVVGVDADLLAGRLAKGQVLLHQQLDLLGVQRAEAVDHDQDAGRRLARSLPAPGRPRCRLLSRRPSGWPTPRSPCRPRR